MRTWFSRYENRRLVYSCFRVIGWIVLSIAVLWGFLHLPVFSVRSVRIAEQSAADQDLNAEVLAFVTDLMEEYRYGIKGSTRYFFKRNEIGGMIQHRFLKVGSVDVTSEFFNRWVVTVAGRKTFGTSCVRTDECYLIDPFGVVFSGTILPVGSTVQVAGDIQLGDSVFGEGSDDQADFTKIAGAVRFLEQFGLTVSEVLVRRDSRVVRIQLESGTRIWMDASESLYDTTRALYIVFEEVFTDTHRQSIVSVDVRNPLSILYEKR